MTAWAGFPEGYSPFKVTCSLHGSPLLVRRGGAAVLGDGFTDVIWQGEVPQSGDGVAHADGSRTFELSCPRCKRPRQARQGTLVRLLREAAASGRDVDRNGVVVLDLAALPF